MWPVFPELSPAGSGCQRLGGGRLGCWVCGEPGFIPPACLGPGCLCHLLTAQPLPSPGPLPCSPSRLSGQCGRLERLQPHTPRPPTPSRDEVSNGPQAQALARAWEGLPGRPPRVGVLTAAGHVSPGAVPGLALAGFPAQPRPALLHGPLPGLVCRTFREGAPRSTTEGLHQDQPVVRAEAGTGF